MALRPADMEVCTPKSRCTYGPNAGQAYDPSNPCNEGSVFNAATCDCDGGTGWDSLEAKWSIRRTGTGVYAAANNTWASPAWFNGYLRWNISSGSIDNSIYVDSAAFVSTTCCSGATYGDQSGVWSIKYMLSASDTELVDPVYRGGCFWPEDCGFCSYSENRDPGCLTQTVYGRLTATRINPDETSPGGSRRDTYLLFDNIPLDSPQWQLPDPEWIIASAPVTTFNNRDCDCAYNWPE